MPHDYRVFVARPKLPERIGRSAFLVATAGAILLQNLLAWPFAGLMTEFDDLYFFSAREHALLLTWLIIGLLISLRYIRIFAFARLRDIRSPTWVGWLMIIPFLFPPIFLWLVLHPSRTSR